jgi:hypothetical protein
MLSPLAVLLRAHFAPLIEGVGAMIMVRWFGGMAEKNTQLNKRNNADT